jgi:N-acetylglucosaminyldiphosphoundecaprenol N-acetyl-beta-D-mannosaminyltransferase
MRLTVAGIPVDAIMFDEAAERAAGFLDDRGQHVIVTPNPEMAVLAARDPGFKKILFSSHLSLADGFGLRLAAWWEKKEIPETITGVDFGLALAQIAEQKNCSVYFLGAGEGIAEKAARNLQHVYKGLRVAGASGDRIRWIAGKWEEDPGLTARIAATNPDVLFVALGHGKQERWIKDHLLRLPSVRIAIGVGGALDYYSGQKRRAPGIFRTLHLEWFWRLFAEPWRAWRIFEATFVFLAMVLKNPRKKVQ